MITQENYCKVNAGHAPMKSINYKNKNQMPENLFPPLLYIPVKESIKWNNYHTNNYKGNLYSYQDDLNMPTCGQLRELWHSSIKQLRENFENKLLENDLPKIFDNPIYLSLLLWQQQQLLKHEQQQQLKQQEQQNQYLNKQINGNNHFESDHPFYKGKHSNDDDDDGVFGKIIYNPNELSQSNNNNNNKNNDNNYNNNHHSLHIQYNRNSDENSLNKEKNANSKEKLIFGKIITHKDIKDSTRKQNNDNYNHDENNNKKNNHKTNNNNNNNNHIDKNRRMNTKFENKFNIGERQKQHNLQFNDDDGDESNEYGEEMIAADQQSSGKSNGHLNSDEFFGSTWLEGPVTPNI